MMDAEFFVALGFLIFVCLLGYLGVHKLLAKGVDSRAERISRDLDEARKLREEAEALLASFKQKAIQAEKDAAAIVAQAQADAEALAKEAAARVADFVARRTKQADAKISLAEAQAMADVRAAAADAAVKAAELVLKAEVKGQTAADLVSKGIGEVGKLLH